MDTAAPRPLDRPLDRAACAALDAADPLAFVRDRFELPDGVIYLDGNSLGPMPRGVAERVAEAVRVQWGRDLITSWNRHDWIGLPRRAGGKIARLIGAEAEEVVVADSTSVNLFKCAVAALELNAPRRVLLAQAGDFPTNLHILQGVARVTGAELRIVPVEALEANLTGEVAALVLTHVSYRSGRVHDMAALTRRAHEGGALAIWDLCHSAGVLDVDLNACEADLAVGCGYKYLNGGPGAPAWIYVARRWQDRFVSPLTGWLGHARPFAMLDAYEPAPGIDRAICGTAPILSLSALDAALDVFEGVELKALRDKAGRLGDLFIRLVDERLSGSGFEVASPRDAAGRGGQVALTHAHAWEICQALIDRNVIPDFRAPDVVRFGLPPSYVRFVDVWDAVEVLRAIMAQDAWREPRFAVRSAVT